jgi:acyl-CoA synthetase (AMP-forming)/AMP-acid ligase II/thioesterase domain-containing protein
VTSSNTVARLLAEGISPPSPPARKESPALVAVGRRPITYEALCRFVGGVGGGLRSSGIGPQDRVGLLVENGPEAASGFLAIASAAAAAPLNPAYGARELTFYLSDMEAQAVVVSSTLDTPVREVAASLGVRVLELHVDPLAPAGVFALEGVPFGAPLDLAPEADDVALVLHTSGTTSRPKLVPLTHRHLHVSAGNVARALRLGSSDRCLNVMPLFHIHGLVAALLASLGAGGAVVCTPGFHQLHFFDWLARLKPTWYTAVPTMHMAVLERAEVHLEAIAQHRLRFVRSSSASLPVSVLERLEAALGVPVIEAYGMTEAAHQIASNPLSPGPRKPGTVGVPAGPQLRVLDAEGRVLPAGEIGEVAIRGDNVFSGYEANPEENDASFADGWFRTGDQGFVDGDGYLTLKGRIKEIINRGGEKISPAEVDEVLLRHDSVALAVTFATPDERLGEEVAAAVVPVRGSHVDERDLQDFVAAELAPFKVPRRIVVVEELPKGPTGKIQRLGLAERLDVDLNGGGDPDRRPYRFLEPQLIAIWESLLGLSNLGVTADFFALGGDSLLATEAVARVRDLVGDPDLPILSIVRAPTPGGMASEVFARVGIGDSGAVPLQDAGERAPLFLVHPGDGEVLAYAALARRLGPDQPSYGLRAPGLESGTGLPPSLQELAACHVCEMQRVQKVGPYLLGGFCVGGAIAVEMASQLRAEGDDVSLLVLLDPRFPRPPGVRYDAWRTLRSAREGRLGPAIRRRIKRWARPPAPNAKVVEDSDFADELERLRERHESSPSEVPATVLLSEGYDDYELPAWYVKTIVRRRLGWHRFPCEHAALLLPPTVDAVAGKIRTAIDQRIVSNAR